MKRTIVIAALLATATAAATAALLFRGAPAPLVNAPGGVAVDVDVAAPSRDVQIRHELIPLADMPAAEALPRLSAAAPSGPARARRIRERRPQSPTLLAKARSALIGNGRHRPEPFPRVR